MGWGGVVEGVGRDAFHRSLALLRTAVVMTWYGAPGTHHRLQVEMPHDDILGVNAE